VANSSGTLIGVSGGGTSNEEVNFVNLAAGNYTVYVHGFAVNGTTPFKLYAWVLGSTAAGNMAVTAPAAATQGATGTINLTFSGYEFDYVYTNPTRVYVGVLAAYRDLPETSWRYVIPLQALARNQVALQLDAQGIQAVDDHSQDGE